MPATEDYFRPLPKMHRWFAVSMIVLFLATLLMMYFDHRDEWRGYQRQFFKLEANKIAAEQVAKKAELAGGDAAAYQAKLAELNAAKDQKNAELKQTVVNLDELQTNVKKLDNDYLMQMREVRKNRAFRDVARANFDLGIRDQVTENQVEALQTEFATKQKVVEDLEQEADRLDAERNKATADLKKKTKEFDTAAGAVKGFEADLTRLQTVKDRIAPEGFVKSIKRSMMEWPIIDGFNSHMKVQQDWLPDMKQSLGMAKTARFDRCRTCHLGIDSTEAGDIPKYPHGDGKDGTVPHPFSTHPRLDVYLTAASPHPLNDFGCTSCHDGQGSATSFQNASHTPNDPNEAHKWAHDHGYFNNHFWESPMLPERMRESACLKCHHSVIELGQNTKFGATAPKAYEGWQLIKKYGCFGCHEINGYDVGKPIGPDLRLEPQTAEEAKKIAEDPKAVAGDMRKVGPSLRHVASKTTPEWLSHWTEEPKRFRPKTKMPQFFHLSNNDGAHGDADGPKFSKLELAAISHYLFDNSQPLKLDQPNDGYAGDVKRGERLFAQKGCLACHSHDAERFKGATAEVGPNLSKVAAKIRPGAEGFNWLYTWIREPERHHARTIMPNFFLEAEGTGENYVDPAADIAAFLLKDGPQKYDAIPVADAELDQLVELLLTRRKTITPAQAKDVMSTRKYLQVRVGNEVFEAASKDAGQYASVVNVVKGDEIELIPTTADGDLSDTEWRRRKINYLGRVTISRYGCYGCHDIPNFETARPIGTALQDWGLKDPSRLAPEHIEEFLHHHGEPDGTSTIHRVEEALRKAKSDDWDSEEQKDSELGAAFFVDSLSHHGRAGFIWQKLRDPRSYDYEKISTKFYDERLRMPKFPLDEKEIESISTFVLGLVARPPMEKYLYRPKGAELAKVEGEKLLQKYNCIGCHMIDLPEITQWMSSKEFSSGFTDLLTPILTARGQTEPTVRQKREQQIEQLLAFVQQLIDLSDKVKSQSQLVYARGIAPNKLILAGDNDVAIDSDSTDEWKQTTHRLKQLSQELKKTADSTKLALLDNGSFQPPALTKKDDESGEKQTKRFAEFQKRLTKLKESAGEDGFSDQLLNAYVDYARSLADIMDQLVLSEWTPAEHLGALEQLAALKPHRQSLLKATREVRSADTVEKQRQMTFRGLVSSRPTADDEPEEAEYGYDLWESLDLQSKVVSPGSRLLVPAARLIGEKPARGGSFAEWLVDDLMKLGPDNNRFLSWQMSPPPLYLEGLKVQTPWLYSFLKNPYKIRHTTVLRMPRFNMSDAEAQKLANYFAAYDGVPYPYQNIPQREPNYVAEANTKYHDKHPQRPGNYLQESWRVLNAPLCIKCHSVGGREFKAADPKKDIRGPNLDQVADRLRPEWITLWLHNPRWITPYTSMPAPFPKNQQQFAPLMDGEAGDQALSARDALMNYMWLMEREGKLAEAATAVTPTAPEIKPEAKK